MTFEWAEITDKMLEKIVFGAFRKRERLIAITDDGQEFLVEFISSVTRETEQEVLERFLGDGVFKLLDDPRHFAENDRRSPFSCLYIRKDFADSLVPVVEGSEISPAEAVRRRLDPWDTQPQIFIQQQPEGWESLVMERLRIKEIEAMLKGTEQNILDYKQRIL